MSKLKFNEIKKIAKESGFDINEDMMIGADYFDVYHYHEWDHGYDFGSGFSGARREFYADMKEMMDFLLDYISLCGITEFIEAPLDRYNQFTQYPYVPYTEIKDIYFEINDFLKKYNVKKNSQSGVRLKVEQNTHIIEMILEGAYRNVSDICLFFPEQSVIIEPTHHFNLIFLTNNFIKEKEIVIKLLEKHPNLRYCEGKYGVWSEDV